MKVSVRKVIDFLSFCSFFRKLCIVKSSLKAKLLRSCWIKQLYWLQHSPQTSCWRKGVSSECGKALCPNVWGLFAWQRDSEGKGSRHCKDRVTANRPQTSSDKRHLSKHTIALDTFVPLSCYKVQLHFSPDWCHPGWRPSIHRTSAGWIHKQSPTTSLFQCNAGEGWCSFSKGLNELSNTSHRMTNHLKLH